MANSSLFLQVPLAELPSATLHVQVLDFKRFSEHKPLGELYLPLGTLDPQHVMECWYQLGPPGTSEVRPLGCSPRAELVGPLLWCLRGDTPDQGGVSPNESSCSHRQSR